MMAGGVLMVAAPLLTNLLSCPRVCGQFVNIPIEPSPPYVTYTYVMSAFYHKINMPRNIIATYHIVTCKEDDKSCLHPSSLLLNFYEASTQMSVQCVCSILLLFFCRY